MSYLRFVRPNRISDQRQREGFFCAAYTLRDDPELDAATKAELEGLLNWFRANLPVPERFNRSRSKGAYRRNTAGLSWFKEDAAEAISKSFELIAMLAEHGYPVEILSTARVGYVVYEDPYQIVAEPFEDTPI